MENLEKSLIVICGVPLSGKSTLALKVAEKLGVKHLDVDTDIRFPIFGKPEQDADLTPQGKEQERVEMLAAYRVMLAAANEILQLGQSVILTATFSRDVYWQLAQEILMKNPETQLKVIQCVIKNDSEDEIWRRIKERGAHTVNSPTHYKVVKERYIDLPVEYLTIDTSGAGNLAEKVEKAVEYITK